MEVLSQIQNMLTEQKKLRDQRKETTQKMDQLKKSGVLHSGQSDLAVWADLGHFFWQQAELGKQVNELTDKVFERLQQSIFGDEMDQEEESSRKTAAAPPSSKQGPKGHGKRQRS